MYLLSASFRSFSRVDLGCNILQKNRSGTTPYDMCTNLSIRQKLLPFVMKATPDVSATVAPMTAPPAVAAPPAAAPTPEPSAVPVFCHPALGRSAHHPQPMPMSVQAPVQAPVQPMAMPAQTQAPVQAAVQAAQPARSFGLATKGPRVVAGTGHPAMASRITRYVPSQAAHPAAHPHPTQPAARPAPAPVAAAPQPMPVASMAAPQPMPVASMAAPQPMPQPAPQPMAQPMPHALPTPLSRPKQPVQPTPAPQPTQPVQPAQPMPQPVQPAPQPISPVFSSPSETPAFVTKPKPAKP